MALNGIPIDENQCIGDSLLTINEAFLELDDRTLNSGAALAALSTYVNAQSAEWANDIDNGVRALTANWENTFMFVNAQSAEWANDIDNGVRALTGNWQSTYTMVFANSAEWANDIDNGVRALTGNWQSTYATVRSVSSDWQSTYTTVKSVSSSWGTVKSVNAAVGTPLTVSNPTVNPVITVTTIPISLGGTGQTDQAAALNALTPNQTGNAGKFLRTNGSGFIYWDTTVDQNEATNLTSIASADAVGIYSSTGLDTAILGATYSYAGVMVANDKFHLDDIRTTVVTNSAFWASNAGVTNLSNSADATTVTIFSDTGTDTILAAATPTSAGVMTADDKTKLNSAVTSIPSTDLSNSVTADDVTVYSSTGNDTTLPAATPTSAGVMTAADKTKLNSSITSTTPTDLSNSVTANDVTVYSSTGNDTTLPAATTSSAGVMTAADKARLYGVDAGAQVNVPTNLSNSVTTTTVTVFSDTGDDTTLPAATTSSAGVMTADDKIKLNDLLSTAATVTEVNVNSPLSVQFSTTTPTITLNTVPIDKGGTGQTTAQAARNALLPTQAGFANQYLKTDGTNVFWSGAGAVTNVQAAANSPITVTDGNTNPIIDITTLPINRGGTGQTTAAAAFNALAPSQSGRANKFLRTDGNGFVSWEEPTTLATIKPIKEITTSTTANNDWSGAAIIAKNTADITITLPQGTMQVGTEFSVIRTNAKVTFAVSTGALKVAPLDTYKSLAYNNSMAGALYIGNNTWHLYGDLLPYEVAT